MMGPEDGAYLSRLINKSERLTRLLIDSQGLAYHDQYESYKSWTLLIDTEDVNDLLVISAVTILGKVKLFDPLKSEYDTTVLELKKLATLAYRYDMGPYSIPTIGTPYTTVDAINVITILDMVAKGNLMGARGIAEMVASGALPGTTHQTLYVMHNLLMIVAFNQATDKVPLVEMRATTLRTTLISVREIVKRTQWCADCAVHAQTILAETDDRSQSAIQDEEATTTDSAWIDMMKREFDK